MQLTDRRERAQGVPGRWRVYLLGDERAPPERLDDATRHARASGRLTGLRGPVEDSGKIVFLYPGPRNHAGVADSPATHGNRGDRRLFDALAAGAVFLGALALYWWLVRAADTQQILTGEEASVSLLDPLGIAERYQFSRFATNFAGHLHYLVWSYLDPTFDLFFGRRWKALAMAFVAPLAYLTLRRRLGTGRGAAVVGAAATTVMPGVASFSWLATENGLEVVYGLLAMLVITSTRRWWPVGGVIAGVGVSVYGGGLSWAVGAVAAAALRIVRSDARARDATWGVVGLAGGAAVAVLPAFWWTNTHAIITGGGGLDLAGARGRLADLGQELAVKGDSYYYFTSAPGLVGLSGAAVAAVAVAVACRRRAFLPYLVVALACVVTYAVSGGVPGIRRAIALSAVAGLAMGVLVDAVVRVASPGWRSLGTAGAALAVAAVITVAVAQDLRTARDLRTSTRALPRDFAFPIAQGLDMPRQLTALQRGLESKALTAQQVAGVWEGERTFAALWTLAERSGSSTRGLPDPASIVRFAREGPRCAADCTPVPGRR